MTSTPLVWLVGTPSGFSAAGDSSHRSLTAQPVGTPVLLKRVAPDASAADQLALIQARAPVGANAFTLGRRRGRPSRGDHLDLAVKFFEIAAQDWTQTTPVQHQDGAPTPQLARALAHHLAGLQAAAGSEDAEGASSPATRDRQLSLSDTPA